MAMEIKVLVLDRRENIGIKRNLRWYHTLQVKFDLLV